MSINKITRRQIEPYIFGLPYVLDENNSLSTRFISIDNNSGDSFLKNTDSTKILIGSSGNGIIINSINSGNTLVGTTYFDSNGNIIDKYDIHNLQNFAGSNIAQFSTTAITLNSSVLKLNTNGTYFGNLKADNLTADKTYQLPNINNKDI